MPAFLKWFLVVLAVFVLFSCSSSHSPADSDIISDSDSDDIETVADDTDSDEDSDFIEDSDETQDQDTDSNTEKSDSDECQPPLSEADFPYYDANGKITFCRPGCDTLTKDDPQCVRNIWEWDNWQDYQNYLKAEKENPGQYGERECYHWPCKLPDTDTSIESGLKTICDRNITVHGFRANMEAVWTHGMSNNVVGMGLSHHTGLIIEYLPNEDYFMAVGQDRGLLSFKIDILPLSKQHILFLMLTTNLLSFLS